MGDIEPKLMSAPELVAARNNRLTPLERELLAHIAALATRGTTMLLEQCQLLVDRNEVACTETVADLLAHIAAQDRQLQALEAENKRLRKHGPPW